VAGMKFNELQCKERYLCLKKEMASMEICHVGLIVFNLMT